MTENAAKDTESLVDRMKWEDAEELVDRMKSVDDMIGESKEAWLIVRRKGDAAVLASDKAYGTKESAEEALKAMLDGQFSNDFGWEFEHSDGSIRAFAWKIGSNRERIEFVLQRVDLDLGDDGMLDRMFMDAIRKAEDLKGDIWLLDQIIMGKAMKLTEGRKTHY